MPTITCSPKVYDKAAMGLLCTLFSMDLLASRSLDSVRLRTAAYLRQDPHSMFAEMLAELKSRAMTRLRVCGNATAHRLIDPLTRLLSYRRDNLSRLELPFELIERHSPCGIRGLAECGFPAPILLR